MMAMARLALPPEIAAIWQSPLRVNPWVSLHGVNEARLSCGQEALPSNELLTEVLLCQGFRECFGRRYRHD